MHSFLLAIFHNCLSITALFHNFRSIIFSPSAACGLHIVSHDTKAFLEIVTTLVHVKVLQICSIVFITFLGSTKTCAQ